MTSSSEISVTDIGIFARRLLAREREASVMGGTSRGLFLHIASGWVVFLSPEAFRGPLTLNYAGGPEDFRPLKIGLSARIYPDRIFLPEPGLAIRTDNALPWEAPPLPHAILPPDGRKAQLTLLAQQVITQQQTSAVSMLLPGLLGLHERSEAAGNPVLPLLERLQQSIREGEIATIVESLEAFLGLGTGLTPSGDDLVMGLLLALTRWGYLLAPKLEVAVLGQDILPMAYRKTTTLSANLIECALQGQANERLLLALDGIVSGHPEPQKILSYLAGWGNTSGLDALVGMALALGIP